MKVVILAGGIGSRLSEETQSQPKPMVSIGGRPILWHIMKLYSHYGFNEFIICLGYKGYAIKEYFANYFLHHSDVTIDLSSSAVRVHNSESEPWTVTLIDTGLDTGTGGRVKRVAGYLDGDTFMLTYGDGVSDVRIPEVLRFHNEQGRLCTVTAVVPESRYGVLQMGPDRQVEQFAEKPQGEGGWINAGFFVCNIAMLKYIDDDPGCTLERGPLERLARDGQVSAYLHGGFWKCMDTMRDRTQLEEMWLAEPKWKVWVE